MAETVWEPPPPPIKGMTVKRPGSRGYKAHLKEVRDAAREDQSGSKTP